ncbi:MAG: toxic anion resistance protein [Methanobrevibacter sp.]|nr:toxic anion resistance protein [Methanobrevibacter sp.]
MTDFSLDVKEIEKEVEDTIQTVEKDSQNPEIQKQAENNAVAIFKTDFDNPTERQNILKPLDDFGLSAISRSASRNKLLATRFADFSKGGEDAGDVGEKLSELNMQMKDLDPSMLDFAKKGFLGNLFNPIRKYFNRYQKAETAIANIIKSLDIGSRTLQNDNTTLLAEEDHLRDLTKKLIADIELGKMMDESIEAQIRKAELEEVEEAKITFVREEILFPLRQRIMDMQQMIVTNQQGIVSLNVIRRNNKELIRGVSRAKNVTVTALRTGVMVASALYNQKIVIKKIQILNENTEHIIESTSRMLREQGSEIQKTSMETMISPEVLKTSFVNAIAAIDDISKFKEQSLPKMQETINLFYEMAQEGQEVVDRIEIEGVGPR